MDVEVIEAISSNRKKGKILLVRQDELPRKRDGWKFAWKQLFKIEGSLHHKLILSHSPHEIQGLLMLTLMNKEMLVMNNIEVAPHNYGHDGMYGNIAGLLIAFACVQSFELGKEHYKGFLSFESKTDLIPYYQEKYGATHAFGQKMFIEPPTGRQLIKEYLGISFYQ